MTGVVALVLTAVALPPLLSRLTGGHAPRPGPQLAALATVAVLPATAAVLAAAFSAWWLALLLAIPAAILVGWQLPPRGRDDRRAATAQAAVLLVVRHQFDRLADRAEAAYPGPLDQPAQDGGHGNGSGVPTASGRRRDPDETGLSVQ